MSAPETCNLAELADVAPENITAEQRKALIEAISSYDSEQFVKCQGEHALDSIKNIKGHQKEFDDKGEKFAASKMSAWMKEHPGQKLTLKQINSFNKTAENQSSFYRKKYANQLLGIGNGALPYCIGLQRSACLKANGDLGYSIMPDIGLSCANARSVFKNQSIGSYHAKVSDCYDPTTGLIRCNPDGTPKLKDGDMILLIDPSDNQAYHCIRANVDENKKVTYSAGNGEAVAGRLNYWRNEACYIIPTSEITKQNAVTHYQQMSNEQLLAAARDKGMFEVEENNDTNQATLSAELKESPQTTTEQHPTTDDHSSEQQAGYELSQLSQNMQSRHNSIQDRIAAFRERRNTESIERADILASMRADHARLQQRRETLGAEGGMTSPAIEYNFTERHYNCEDIAARQKTSDTPEIQAPAKELSGLQKFMNFFRSTQYG
ncbi:MAG: hypothetical protein IJ689_05375 [Alphaproteobacteria bacterium]|nr:hypothetical protein [Alphaproteobacteria bacterium]